MIAHAGAILLLTATLYLLGFAIGRATADPPDRCASADTVILPDANGKQMVAKLC